MKKFMMLVAVTSLLSVSAFADSMYKSSETTTIPSSGTTSTVKEKQQRMEDDGRSTTREVKSKTKNEVDSMGRKIEKRTEKTSSELAE